MAIELTHEELEHAFECLSEYAMMQKRRYTLINASYQAQDVHLQNLRTALVDEKRRNKRREHNLAARASRRLEAAKQMEIKLQEQSFEMSLLETKIEELVARINRSL